MAGHRHYVGVTYISGRSMRLPRFFGGINGHGNGVIVFRYGGQQFRVYVIGRALVRGWDQLVERAKLKTGTNMLLGHSSGNIVSLLCFKKGIGLNEAWANTVGPIVDSGLFENGFLPADVDVEVRKSAYYPRYMTTFLLDQVVLECSRLMINSAWYRRCEAISAGLNGLIWSQTIA